jgi:hypothetical protein
MKHSDITHFHWRLLIIGSITILLVLIPDFLSYKKENLFSVRQLVTSTVQAQVPGCSINEEKETTAGGCYTLTSTSTCIVSGQAVIIGCSLSSCDGGQTVQGGCSPILSALDQPSRD